MYRIKIILFFAFFSLNLFAQNFSPPLKSRSLRYIPDKEDFIITNGTKRFTRSLYGTNTAFRIEAGDLPEFALYFPGMGGNMHFALVAGDNGIWLNQAQTIKARYIPGSMLYEISDPILGSGTLFIQLLAMNDAEGMIIQVRTKDCNLPLKIITVFGGASNKKFSRSGDIGADPESSFYLKAEYCRNNRYSLKKNIFNLTYGSEDTSGQKHLTGIFPETARLRLADALNIDDLFPLLNSTPGKFPVLLAELETKSIDDFYLVIQNSENQNTLTYADLPELFNKADNSRKELANRVKVITPDPYINTVGGALSIAADAIWDGTSYQHGAVAWRMPLNGWRGAYVADPLGWHDRAKKHFCEYAKAQYLSPDSGPCVPDPEKGLARQQEKEGISLYTNGYISRSPGKVSKPHHYDMNLVFIDQLLTHFKWTGDTAFLRGMWPVIKRHLAWEKRNFDQDGDGLYDAYCCIWASDALQYSGGGVAHSSAYNYRGNKMAAYLAEFIGEDPKPYKEEADKIVKAIRNSLWMKGSGWYAEYKDLLGLKQLHPAAGLWTVYHTLDSEVANSFEAYQTLKYIDNCIPHIPINAEGLRSDFYTLSTTNWMPYTWSINNVVFAEVLHTSLANWEGGRTDEAFKLWKGSLLESMYLGSSAGNFQQISSYDPFRGELYRDFADPIGMAARTLVEGLFGIIPDALSGDLYIRPGLPSSWDHATLHIPDLDYTYMTEGEKDRYAIIPRFSKPMKLTFRTIAKRDGIKAVYVNSKKVIWKNVESAVNQPEVEFSFAPADTFIIEILWNGSLPATPKFGKVISENDTIEVHTGMAEIMEVYDPQLVTQDLQIDPYRLKTKIIGSAGYHTFFIKVDQNQVSWWQPIDIEIRKPLEIITLERQDSLSVRFVLKNNSQHLLNGSVFINPGKNEAAFKAVLRPGETSQEYFADAGKVITGTNQIQFQYNKSSIIGNVVNWNIKNGKRNYQTIDLTYYFNDRVTDIFKNKYLSPRLASPTLQLPVQGIGNWCYPLVEPEINDEGLRSLAGNKGLIELPQGIPFKINSDSNSRNILFTSQWDNYPVQIEIPLSGRASHAYFLMTGTTNPMQSRIVNGVILLEYTDGTSDSLELRNPETWWPIEQDYYSDGYAFRLNAPKPIRVHLKTGLITTSFADYISLKGFSTTAIEGGAATVLDLPLDSSKKLKRLVLKTLCNDVIIGLMGITLLR